MSWKEKIKEFGGGDFSFLSEDGEVVMFVVVGLPMLLEGRYKGKPSEKIGCPIFTSDGFVLFITGKRLARKISKHEDQFHEIAFMAIRHGEQNDITSSYELRILDNPEVTAELLEKSRGKDFSQQITDAVEDALTVMRQ